jgi:hypothetical protein
MLAGCIVLFLLTTCAMQTAFAATGSDREDNSVNPHQLPDSSFIYDTSILDLSQADSYYNNQTVQVVGEAIGDRIDADPAGEHCWIVLASLDKSANANITVYMDKAEAARIDSFGKYGTTGTVLRVRGTFHLACTEHDGLSDIHAEQVSLIEAGKQSPDSFDTSAFIPGAVSVALGLAMLAVFYLMRERRR